MTGDNELLTIFRQEVSDHLAALNDGLLKIEMGETGDKTDLLREMNRVAHSMKGAARAVGFGVVERISHLMEEVFGAVLAGTLVITPDVADSLYDGLDLIQGQMDGDTPDASVLDAVTEALKTIATAGTSQAETGATPKIRDTGEISTTNGGADDFAARASALIMALRAAQDPLEKRRIAHQLRDVAHDAGRATSETVAHYIETLLETDNLGDVRDLVESGLELIEACIHPNPPGEKVIAAALADLEGLIAQHRARALPQSPPPVDQTPAEPDPNATVLMRPPEETLRVRVSRLDQLMAEASELLVAQMQVENVHERLREMVRQHNRWQREWRSARNVYIRLVRRLQAEDSDLMTELSVLFRFLEANQRYLSAAQRDLSHLSQTMAQDTMMLNTVADSIQQDIANLRMMPVSTITGSFQRMVRDLARDTGKQAALVVEGADVEVDKSVLDALKDPLVHLLRNAVDHGIESPDQRAAAGKPIVGQIVLRAEQRGSEMILSVRDDGRGIDADAVRRKAVRLGLLTENEAASMPDDAIYMLIFESGFSTADRVTSISGRGLGMDIVQTRVQSLRGRVNVISTPGQGTESIIGVPVSLTRIRAVLLRLGDDRYAIPSAMVSRMLLVPRSEIFAGEGQPALLLDERPVALLSLAQTLNLPPGPPADPLHIVALKAGDRSVAFEVDGLESEVELVLKPLGRELAALPNIAGAALLGSGEVIIVLDGNDLVRSARGESWSTPQVRLHEDEAPVEGAARRVLIVDDSITTRTLEKNILEAEGYLVHVAIDGAEAWQRIADVVPEIVISDVEMPKMDGLELTRRLKANAQTQHIPVVLLTSLAKPEQREAGLRAGADAYLVKSQFDQSDLLQTIRQLL